jgi:uncharacterized protein DUF6079
MRISEALELPQISALDEFITRLDDTEDRVLTSLKQFVLTDEVQKKLDVMLNDVGARLAQGRDTGRFIFGTFGSGKSHLMTVLGKMLERDETVYAVGDPGLATLRSRNDWLDKNRTLVVRVNMMGKSSLSSALYNAFNAALPAGVPPLQFTNEKRIFELIDQDAQRHYGSIEKLVAKAVEDKAIPSVKFYERLRKGDLNQQLDLAARLQGWRDHGEKAVRPEDLWIPAPEGFARISRHAKEHGYTAITWLIDELVIWIRGKNSGEYMAQINELSALVDHDGTAVRVVPFFVAVAVQQDIAETCPGDISEKGFRAQLGFISDRFSPPLKLEDQDLYEVASRRVLRPRPEAVAAFDKAVDATFRKYADAIKDLSGNLDPALVRKLYPFHPALLRVLVDVTQALSRSRTAMAALYGLLKKHPDLEVGSFLPLGALFDIIFTHDNVESVRKREQSSIAKRFVDAYDTYERLGGKLDSAAGTVPGAQPEELHQLVRTVLLCQLSEKPYFPTGQSLRERVTATTVLRLNQSDVRSLTERTGVSKVIKLFKALHTEPQVQVTGDVDDPLIVIKTEQVDIEKVLAQARNEVTHSNRFAYCLKLIDGELGLGLGKSTRTTTTVNFRGTKRKGVVRVANVRALGYAGLDNEFDPGDDEFLVLIDYPFDEKTGATRQDDLDTVQAARARKRQWTVAWLPEHFSDGERRALDNAAAIEKIGENRRHYLDAYAPRDAQAIASSLEAFRGTQNEVLKDAIRRLYFEEGTIHGCSEQLDGISVVGRDRGKAVDGLGTAILDARYPQHPHFKRRVVRNELERLAELVAIAAQTGQHVDVKGLDAEYVEAYGVPLEMVYKSENSISRRTDGRFLSAIHAWISKEPGRFKASVVREKLVAGGKEGFGFSDDVVRFFLFYLLQVDGYEAKVKGDSLTIDGLASLPADFELVKADVVDAPTWDKARTIARKVCGVEGRVDLPSPPEQSKLSRDVGTAARKLKDEVDIFLTHLKRVLDWANIAPGTSKRADTVARLSELLGKVLEMTAHADRMRVLAALDGNALVEPYAVLRQFLADEQSALASIESQKRAFQEIGERGEEDEKKTVVLALQNVLREPISEKRRLANLAKDWVAEADKIFGALLERERQLRAKGINIVSVLPVIGGNVDHGNKTNLITGKLPTFPPPGPVGDDSVAGPKSVRKGRKSVAKAGLRDAVLAALVDALVDLEGEQFDVELMLRKVRDPKDGSAS